jgi:16S rRNA (guanine966-N2)-methyltransferase
VTRIIGGEAGGRRLRTPPGAGTRPTSDRVREALFSALEAALGSLHGVRFLDLYAGSGAVGLEAGSRGARAVTSVERDRRAAAVIRHNATSLGLSGVDVVVGSVSRALAEPPPAPYDVAFLDPPYSAPASEVAAVLAALCGHGWLGRGAIVVVERSSRDPAPEWPQGLAGTRSRSYGETALWYGRATA